MRFACGVLGLLLLACVGSAIAQSDYHLDADPAKALYRSSVWAHGYIHGYEAGYHYGNYDMQISGGARGEKQMKKCRGSKRHYQKSFGSRSSFDGGFNEGFKAGYADGVTGEVFRAAEQARSLVFSEKLFARSPVDEGIATGYVQGRTAGLSDARLDASFSPSNGRCPESGEQMQGYCDSYAIGFRWGYSDGYHNQRPGLQIQTRSALRRP